MQLRSFAFHVFLCVSAQSFPVNQGPSNLDLDCEFGSLANGRTIFEEIRPGWSKLSFVCDENFFLDGPNYFLCHNGTFDQKDVTPRCISNTCSVPLILHGTVQPFLEEYQPGVSIQVRCQPGYSLEDVDAVLQCNAEGAWVSLSSQKFPRCVESLSANCHSPSPLQDGSLEIEGLNSLVRKVILNRNEDYDAQAKASCNPGYRLIPPESHLRHCKDGIWFGVEPKCVPESCESPPPIKHGYHVALSSKFVTPFMESPSKGHYAGSSLQFLCDTGYRLQGPSVIRCTNQGTWLPTGVPDCIPQKAHPAGMTRMCPPLDHLFHVQLRTVQGWLSVEGANESTILELWCQPGYRNRKETLVTHGGTPSDRVSSGLTRLQCANGSWVGETLNCVEGCGEPPYIANGQVEILEGVSSLSLHTSVYPILSTIVYVCQRGYWLHGSSMLTCQPDGCWEPRISPDCVPENQLFGWDRYDKDSFSTSLIWVVSLGTACSVCLLLALVWLLVACRTRQRSGARNYGLVRQEICLAGPSRMDTAVQTSQTGMEPRSAGERSWPWTSFCTWSTNSESLSPSPTNSAGVPMVSQDPDRLALIAFADGVQVVLPTYEEAVQEHCPPPYDVAVASGTRLLSRRVILGQQRRMLVVTSTTLPIGSHQSMERDTSDSLSQHSSVSAPFCPMRHTSGMASTRSRSVGESLGSLDTVAAVSEVSGLTATTVDTFSSGMSGGGLSRTSNQSRNPSTQGVCGSLASMDGALV